MGTARRAPTTTPLTTDSQPQIANRQLFSLPSLFLLSAFGFLLSAFGFLLSVIECHCY
jgi:hypothetical protein